MSGDRTGIRRILKALAISLHGVRTAFSTEAAFRQEMAIAAVLLPAAFIIDVSGAERALLVAVTMLVLIVELINSAIEKALDRFSADIHPLTKAAKDMGSAAVFLSLVTAGLVWAIIVWGRITG